MTLKLILINVVKIIVLYLLYYFFIKKRELKINWRLALSFFIIGTWFGIACEIFGDKIASLFQIKIWEYRILEIHDGASSLYGPLLWSMMGLYIYIYQNFIDTLIKNKSKFLRFLSESGYLLVLEFIFNLIGYLVFNEYFFYYFAPDLFHLSTFLVLPLWWGYYHVIIRLSSVFYKKEKLNIVLAVLMLVLLLSK